MLKLFIPSDVRFNISEYVNRSQTITSWKENEEGRKDTQVNGFPAGGRKRKKEENVLKSWKQV